MRPVQLILAYGFIVGGLFGQSTRSSNTLVYLTSGEQSAALSTVPSARHATYLDVLEDTIRSANRGVNVAFLRVPISTPQLYVLQAKLATQGRFVPMSELKPAVDVAHTLVRETPSSSLAAKVARYAEVERKPMHGAVAEYAEARARNMVLTKSRVSETYDLTEAKFGPRNAQMKIFAKEMTAIDKLEEDLLAVRGKERVGIVPKSTIELGVAKGRILEMPSGYRSVKSSGIIFEESKVFTRPAASKLYTQTGRASLLTRSSGSVEEISTVATFQNTTKWLGRASLVGMFGIEAYSINEYSAGRISERHFWTTQAGIAGGVAGGWTGAKAGAATGAFIGAALTPEAAGAGAAPGALVGGIIGGLGGGYAGAKLGEGALDHYYNTLDAEQNEKLRQFIYASYKASP